MICDRCGYDAFLATGSYFNTDLLCPACVIREQAHPLYEHAVEVEHEAVRGGDFNFPIFRDIARRQDALSGIFASGSVDVLRVSVEGYDELQLTAEQIGTVAGLLKAGLSAGSTA